MLLELLLPPQVACSEAYDDTAAKPLFPGEAELIAKAGERRRAEFTTTRTCARDALAALGEEPVAVLRGDRGAPAWPAGVVGSLTHCAGFRGAVAARTDTVASVGIDAEPAEPLPDGVERLIASAVESERLAALAAARPDVHWSKLMFCVKEAVYKTWFPLTGRWLGFAECHVDLEADGTFRARLLVDEPPVVDGVALPVLDGRWVGERDLLLAAIVVPRR